MREMKQKNLRCILYIDGFLRDFRDLEFLMLFVIILFLFLFETKFFFV